MVWLVWLCVVVEGLVPGLHRVEEGHVGLYWRGGALLHTVTEPGFHWMLPLVTQHKNLLVTLQTDQVRDIPCGTAGGVVIYFGMPTPAGD